MTIVAQSRARSIQGPPPSSVKLRTFPHWGKGFRQRIWRAARSVHADPWWWSGDGCGRFDLTSGGMGTIYFSTDRIGGLLESLGMEMKGGAIHLNDLTSRKVYGLESSLISSRHLANMHSPKAAGFGVTNEITSMTPYDVPQGWAAALYAADFEGIIYRTRFDVRSHTFGLALFGVQGGNHLEWPIEVSYPATRFKQELKEKFNIDILEDVSLDNLPKAKLGHAVFVMNVINEAL